MHPFPGGGVHQVRGDVGVDRVDEVGAIDPPGGGRQGQDHGSTKSDGTINLLARKMLEEII